MAITTETFTLTGDTTTRFELSFAVWDSGADISVEIDDGTNPVSPAAFTASNVGTGSTATLNVPSASGVSGTLYVYYNPAASGMLGTYTAPMVPVSTLSTEFNGLWTALGLVEDATNEALRLDGASPQAYDAAAYAVSSDFTSYGSNGRALVAYDDMIGLLSVTNVTTTLGAAGEVLMSNGSAYGPTTTFTGSAYTFSGNVTINEDLYFQDETSSVYVNSQKMLDFYQNATAPRVTIYDPTSATNYIRFFPRDDIVFGNGQYISGVYGGTIAWSINYTASTGITDFIFEGDSRLFVGSGKYYAVYGGASILHKHDGVRTFKVYNASDQTSYVEMDIDDGNDTRLSLYYDGSSYLDLLSDPNGSTIDSGSVALTIRTNSTMHLRSDGEFASLVEASGNYRIKYTGTREAYIYNSSDQSSYVHWDIDDGNDVLQEFSYDGVVELSFLADPDLSQIIAKSGLKISSTDAATTVEIAAPFGLIIPSVAAGAAPGLANITGPTAGQIVLNTTDSKFYGYTGAAWVAFH